MNKTSELAIKFDSKQYFYGLKVASIMLIIVMGFIFLLSNMKAAFITGIPILDSLLFFLIKFFLHVVFIVFLIGIIWGLTGGLYIIKNKGSALVINNDGIWIKYYNFIPWDNVEEITPYIMFGTTTGIGVRIKKIEMAFKNSERFGKISLFFTNLFKVKYHITLSNLDTGDQDILGFIKQFKK